MSSRGKFIGVLAAGMAIAAWPISNWAAGGKMLDKIVTEAWRDAAMVSYAAPSSGELATMRTLFTRLLKGEPATAMAADLRALGWDVFTASAGGVTWTVVAEAPDQRRGRGLYAFSRNGRHLLQAPHVPSDELTGRILLRYADDGLPRALAWNTVPRGTADLAHLEGTHLIAFSHAFAQVYPSEKIVQFHGFDTRRRRSAAGAQSRAIVSAAHRHSPIELKSAVKCMQQKIEKETRLYGVDVSELGGTRNSVARALRNDGYEGFVHVELDLPLREQLVRMPGKRQALLDCLGGAS